MKESQSAYTECAENQLPRAHKLYRRKCQEAEESRMAPAIPMPPNPHGSNNPSDNGRPLFSPSQEAFSPPPSYANLHSPEGGHAHPTPNAAAGTSSTGLVSTTSRVEGPDRARSPPPQVGPRAAIQDFTQQSALPSYFAHFNIRTHSPICRQERVESIEIVPGWQA
jgi:hypothetical protein